MERNVKFGISLVFRTLFIAVVLYGFLGSPCMAKSKKKERQSSDNPGKVVVAESIQVETDQRRVLLVASPKHATGIENGSTIAFIEFDHVVPTAYLDNVLCVNQVSSALAQHLADLNRYKVATRDHIETVMQEIEFSNSGSVNSTTATKLGELIGADILIYGKVQLCSVTKPDFKDKGSSIPQKQNTATASSVPHVINPVPNAISGILQSAPVRSNIPGLSKGSGLLGLATGIIGVAQQSRKQKKEAKAKEAEVALAARQEENIVAKDNEEKKESLGKMRSLILARVQLIEAKTGKQIFTTSLRGEYHTEMYVDDIDISDQELYSNAAGDLANNFIDNFLARRAPRYVDLYTNSLFEFDRGVDLIQLGDCAGAEAYFGEVYNRHKERMDERNLANLMYNHGIAAMCSNRTGNALDKLWASLRLFPDDTTFRAIEFTNDMIDQGREVKPEGDLVIRDVRLNGRRPRN